MKTRCLNPNHPTYASHGALGDTIAHEWLDYDQFVADMGQRPPRASLRRIDATKPHGPGNCRWATKRLT